MPHFILEYSGNLRGELDTGPLFEKLRDCAVETGIFPLGGIRFRALCCDEFLVADGDPANAFVHMTIKVGQGRTTEVRRKAAEKVFATLTAYLKPIYDSRPMGISLELTELDPDLSFKQNNIHQRLKSRYDSTQG